MFSLSDYDYTLPSDRIAQTVVHPPESCKLLYYEQQQESIEDLHMYDLPRLLDPQTLIVFNTSKVVKARLLFPDISGELLFLQRIDEYTCEALVRPGKKRKAGQSHILPGTDIHFTVEALTAEGRIVKCSQLIFSVLEAYGHMPLPPYIDSSAQKEAHYQPAVANDNTPGSVAAPTAALHFSSSFLEQLSALGHTFGDVTLHIGLGTFKNVDVEDITAYRIHQEQAEVSYALFDQIALHKKTMKPLLAIGTTSTRTLESLPYVRQLMPSEQKSRFGEGTVSYRDGISTNISDEQTNTFIKQLSFDSHTIHFGCELYIYPGFQFRVIDQLITNFHLPKSSLLMLVAGFIGYEQMKTLYAHALTDTYRFFSFGDAMFLKRKGCFVK